MNDAQFDTMKYATEELPVILLKFSTPFASSVMIHQNLTLQIFPTYGWSIRPIIDIFEQLL